MKDAFFFLPLLLSYNSIVVRVKKEGNKYSTAQVRTPIRPELGFN